jgi:diguanylate cyclase (GGDEF)-like protein
MIICPETNRKGAYILAENLRQEIASKTIANAGHITCSFGIAEYILGQGENALVAEADKALYQAKKRGRNMVVSD